MNEKNTLAVAYSTDDNYTKFLGISMLSLFENNTDFEKITVYIMDCGILEENRKRLTELAQKWGREVVFVSMSGALETLGLRMGAHKISVASYARLFLTTVIPEDCDRIIYIDCDTIVMDSLRGMWETEMGDAYIAGVQDTVDKYFQQIIGLSPEIPYMNAGILLINLKAWREKDLPAKFREVIARFEGNVPHHDQGCINCACQENRVKLDVRYNFTSNMYSFSSHTIRKIYFLDSFYSQEEIDRAIAKPAIVHFTSGLVGRPWEENCTHPMKDAFWHYAKQSPWSDLKMEPDRRKAGLKAFIAFHKLTPTPVFEFVYRQISWVLHLRK